MSTEFDDGGERDEYGLGLDAGDPGPAVAHARTNEGAGVTRDQFLSNVAKGHEANAAHMRKMACPDQERWYLEVAAAVRSLVARPTPTKDPR